MSLIPCRDISGLSNPKLNDKEYERYDQAAEYPSRPKHSFRGGNRGRKR